jgi:hypothetical protein
MPIVSSANRAMFLVMALFALLLTVKYFPGFEQSHPYSGNAFQVIHPDAFAGDPYKSPDKPVLSRPFQLSLLYALVKLGGEIWLDDRFVAAFYLGLVFAGLLGIDRIAQLLGIEAPLERVLILMLFLKDHAVLKNFVLLSHHPDVNHFALAIPISVWLIYAALARKKLIVVLALSALLAATSVRMAVFPIFFALVIAGLRGSRNERLVVACLFLTGFMVAYIGLFHLYAMPGDLRLQLWDLIEPLEGKTSNAFDNWGIFSVTEIIVRNLVWVGLCAGSIMATVARYPAFGDIKVIIITALIIWLVSAIYVNFAPDFLKMPLLLPLAAVRGLGLPQNLAYVAITAGLLYRIREHPDARMVVIAALAFGVLAMLGPGNHLMWAGLVVAGFAVALVFNYATERSLKPAKPVRFMAHAVGVVIVVSYSVAAWQKAPAWKVWAETGIYGNSQSAKWIGVAEYIRENTSKTASVLPLFIDSKRGLWASRTLGSRAGRAMPVPEHYGDLLNLDFWRFAEQQRQQLKRVFRAFTEQDLASANRGIEKLVPVADYIVIPTGVLPPLDKSAFPYVEETRIRGFTILKREPV